MSALDKDSTPRPGNIIEDECIAVLAEHENESAKPTRKRKRAHRGRPKKARSHADNIDRIIPSPLAVGRKTRMNIKVAECIRG